MRFFLFLLTVSLFALHADDLQEIDPEKYASLIDFETAPSAIVSNVNVITGHYVETETDYLSRSASPIHIQRNYNSGSDRKAFLGGRWDLTVWGSVFHRNRRERIWVADVDYRNSLTVFKHPEKNGLHIVDYDFLKRGVSNTAPPKLAGRVNLGKSWMIISNNCPLMKHGAEILFFGRKQGDSNYSLTNVTFGNGCHHYYAYKGDSSFDVDRIQSYDAKRALITEVVIAKGSKERNIKLVCDEGKTVEYHRSDFFRLDRVETNFSPPVNYQYDHQSGLMISKSLPDHRYLNISYQGGKKKPKKVSALEAPVGTDEQPKRLYTFVYDGRKTYVTDARGNRSTYRWNEEDRLTTIRHYCSDNTTLYRSEELRWGCHRLWDPTHFRSHYIVDAQGYVWAGKQFYNDNNQKCVTKEEFYGNLSGQGKLYRSNGQGEKYIKTYTYYPNNLIESETFQGEGEDFKQRITYTYYGDSSLVKTKMVSDPSGIKERYYYAYAPCGEVAFEIVDDGSSSSINDLAGVTRRTFKRIKLSSKGVPIEEAYSYLDLQTGTEKQLSRVVNHYSSRRLIVKKDYYDTENTYLYSESWKYNDYELITEEIDRAGRVTTCSYDANGNCIRKSFPHLQYQILYTYDFSNRLIKEEELHDDGRSFVKSYAYDLKGNKIKEVDPCGHETLYTYDPYDRLIAKTLPPVEDSSGKLSAGVERYTYNVLNHLSSREDPDGKITRILTTAYGKPYRIEYPDKTVEHVLYNKDGSLKMTTDAQGTKTQFAYDYKSRKIKEEKISREGELLSIREWKYSAFDLLEEIDPEGNATTYTYNGAGQLTAKRKGDAETLIFYDTLGREKEKWEKCSDHTYRITVLEYNLLDQVVEEKIIDESGNLFLLKQYAYDAWGNRTREIIGGHCPLSTDYNSSSQPVRTVTAEGFETLFHYDNDYLNTFGQTVAAVTEIDPKGNVTFTVFDARGRPAVQERKNTYAETVQKTEYLYNQIGKPLLQKESVIVSGEILRIHTTAFEYDLRDREITVIEAKGEPEQKITRRTYTAFGEVEEIIKPSQVIVNHAYDPLGRLSSLKTSDGAISYTYTYDRNNNILEVEDLISQSRTTRIYDIFGNIVSETLAHGSTLEYAYDPLSRLTEVTLPDSSSISYSYDAGYLREIRRGRYVHKDNYGSHGKRLSSQMVQRLGEIHYAYDQSLRPSLIESQYLKMEMAYDAIGNVEAVDYTDDLGSESYSYQYDAMNQLISDNSHQYTFDSLGNRVACDGVDNTHNALNQLLKQGENTYRYDADGNLIAKNEESYVYDAFGRLTEALKENLRTTYTYDPFHRRLSKTRFTLQEEQWVEISSEKYLYQGDKEIGTIGEHGELESLRVMGVGVKGDVGAAVLMEFLGRAYLPLHDYRGNVSMLVDAVTAEVVESYRFDAFGVETVSSQSEAPLNPWRFSSKRVDAETGWVYFGARYYDAEMGRWTTPDPMWFVNGTNLYCYVRNNPTMYIDSEGLFFNEIVKFLKDTFRAIFKALVENVDVSADERGNIQVNFNTHPSLDHQSKSTSAKNDVYGSVHVMTVNGIFNSYEESEDLCGRMSELAGGCTSSFVYNASHGVFDLIESFLNLLGIVTRPAQLLHKEWDHFFANCPEDGIIIMVCHSQGAILTRNALSTYDEELRKRIHVVAVAPAAYIDEGLCGSVMHYVSKRDFVPWIDVVGRMRNRHTTVELDPHPDAPFFDHAVSSPTYQDDIDKRIQWIRKHHGDYR